MTGFGTSNDREERPQRWRKDNEAAKEQAYGTTPTNVYIKKAICCDVMARDIYFWLFCL